MEMNNRLDSQGFSLVELSIVLVILGLLTGGILGGQALMRAAELRSVSTDIEKYKTAIYTFRDKYFALPGDMTNATAFWGAADTSGTGGQCANPDSDTGTGTQTCNGNGNGLMGSGSTSAQSNSEVFRIWQHLASAGLIEGSYTGVGDNTGGGTFWLRAIPGENVAALKLNNAGITIVAHPRSSNGTGAVMWTGADSSIYRNYAYYSGQTAGDLTWASIYSTEELWNMDNKMDDGKPGLGKISSHAATTCVTSNVDTTSEYALNNTGKICTLLVDMGL